MCIGGAQTVNSAAEDATWRTYPIARSLSRLLKAISCDRADLTLGDLHPDQIRWVLEVGLGPLLRRYGPGEPSAAASPVWRLVEASDLTARVIVGEHMDALDEIVHACERLLPPVTLLKGISLCDQYYPEPHLRLMRDIDILVDEASIPVIESILLGLGYLRESKSSMGFYEAHHHTTPLFHPRRHVWLEVHRGLVRSDSHVGGDRVFGLENLRAELRPSAFRGLRVNRLSDELQLVYIASHWALEFRRVGGMVGMVDIIYLLTNARSLRWERILDWLDGAVASTYLYLLLTYLDRQRIIDIDVAILRELSLRQRSLGAVSLKALHAIIDHYIVNGSEFGLLVSARNFEIIQSTLLSPGRPRQNILRLFWNLLPSRAALARTLSRKQRATGP